MVLQDIQDASPSGFGDEPPPDNSRTPPSGRRFDSSQLARPLPIIGPLLGFSEGIIRFKTESTIKYAEQKVHRPLTHAEAQALASHLYKLEQSKSYFAAGGVGAGIWRWWATMADSRYPFYKPKPEDINPNKFMFVKGPLAHTSRHSWRLMLYAFVAGEAGKLIGQIIAQPLAARNTAADPALTQFSADLKGAMTADVQKGREHATQMQTEWQERIKRDRQARSNPNANSAPTQSSTSDDDMSPASDNDPWSSSASPQSDSGFSSSTSSTYESPDFSSPDSQPQPQRQTQRSQPPPNPWSYSSPSNNDDDNDASPTGGLFQDDLRQQNQQQQNSPTPRPGESSWERLRRTGGSPPSSNPPPQPQRNRRPNPNQPQTENSNSSTLGDDFTFAESDAERKRGQERAQREFDERLERERQGRDFNDENRKW